MTPSTARALPRPSFDSSSLVRSLARFAPVAVPGPSAAERLGQWLGIADAMAVYGALQTGAAPAAESRTAAPAGASDVLQAEIIRVRDTLAAALAAGDRADAGRPAGRRLPRLDPGTPVEVAADFAPYHRYHLTLQRDMAAAIGPLRTRARAALAAASPRLRQLAELDAVLDQAYGERERELLATVPTLLETRFNALRDQRQRSADAPANDDPGTWLRPGGWLAVFRQELHDLLLRELDLRLLPAQGLLDAWRQEEHP